MELSYQVSVFFFVRLLKLVLLSVFSRMESAYRVWIKEKRQGRVTVESDQLCIELQAALSTAKWQVRIHTYHRLFCSLFK